ncbi:histidine kinase dimerization/phospho-acceptor domain-containing protein [Schinkia azotoformans]|uniref:histidine kinase dimerization/phospho-acceptor domain-containing protein n=1 Tax=Schinkia azotoformans TaxID=1454 RepID=UPI002E251FD3|nr:histidine kinase dimerization/phospho-acceptor domain-containing protein [Schinkia azotoformans]MED4352258.1 histidine kinase dimerization/phospho-acceptor domain-containing protein [Schinkia azotoformans]
MKMISQLAASISHEVRNPLTTSRGLLQLMNETEFKNHEGTCFAITFPLIKQNI